MSHPPKPYEALEEHEADRILQEDFLRQGKLPTLLPLKSDSHPQDAARAVDKADKTLVDFVNLRKRNAARRKSQQLGEQVDAPAPSNALADAEQDELDLQRTAQLQQSAMDLEKSARVKLQMADRLVERLRVNVQKVLADFSADVRGGDASAAGAEEFLGAITGGSSEPLVDYQDAKAYLEGARARRAEATRIRDKQLERRTSVGIDSGLVIPHLEAAPLFTSGYEADTWNVDAASHPQLPANDRSTNWAEQAIERSVDPLSGVTMLHRAGEDRVLESQLTQHAVEVGLLKPLGVSKVTVIRDHTAGAPSQTHVGEARNLLVPQGYPPVQQEALSTVATSAPNDAIIQWMQDHVEVIDDGRRGQQPQSPPPPLSPPGQPAAPAAAVRLPGTLNTAVKSANAAAAPSPVPTHAHSGSVSPASVSLEAGTPLLPVPQLHTDCDPVAQNRTVHAPAAHDHGAMQRAGVTRISPSIVTNEVVRPLPLPPSSSAFPVVAGEEDTSSTGSPLAYVWGSKTCSCESRFHMVKQKLFEDVRRAYRVRYASTFVSQLDQFAVDVASWRDSLEEAMAQLLETVDELAKKNRELINEGVRSKQTLGALATSMRRGTSTAARIGSISIVGSPGDDAPTAVDEGLPTVAREKMEARVVVPQLPLRQLRGSISFKAGNTEEDDKHMMTDGGNMARDVDEGHEQEADENVNPIRVNWRSFLEEHTPMKLIHQNTLRKLEACERDLMRCQDPVELGLLPLALVDASQGSLDGQDLESPMSAATAGMHTHRSFRTLVGRPRPRANAEVQTLSEEELLLDQLLAKQRGHHASSSSAAAGGAIAKGSHQQHGTSKARDDDSDASEVDDSTPPPPAETDKLRIAVHSFLVDPSTLVFPLAPNRHGATAAAAPLRDAASNAASIKGKAATKGKGKAKGTSKKAGGKKGAKSDTATAAAAAVSDDEKSATEGAPEATTGPELIVPPLVGELLRELETVVGLQRTFCLDLIGMRPKAPMESVRTVRAHDLAEAATTYEETLATRLRTFCLGVSTHVNTILQRIASNEVYVDQRTFQLQTDVAEKLSKLQSAESTAAELEAKVNELQRENTALEAKVEKLTASAKQKSETSKVVRDPTVTAKAAKQLAESQSRLRALTTELKRFLHLCIQNGSGGNTTLAEVGTSWLQNRLANITSAVVATTLPASDIPSPTNAAARTTFSPLGDPTAAASSPTADASPSVPQFTEDISLCEWLRWIIREESECPVLVTRTLVSIPLHQMSTELTKLAEQFCGLLRLNKIDVPLEIIDGIASRLVELAKAPWSSSSSSSLNAPADILSQSSVVAAERSLRLESSKAAMEVSSSLKPTNDEPLTFMSDMLQLLRKDLPVQRKQLIAPFVQAVRSFAQDANDDLRLHISTMEWFLEQKQAQRTSDSQQQQESLISGGSTPQLERSQVVLSNENSLRLPDGVDVLEGAGEKETPLMTLRRQCTAYTKQLESTLDVLSDRKVAVTAEATLGEKLVMFISKQHAPFSSQMRRNVKNVIDKMVATIAGKSAASTHRDAGANTDVISLDEQGVQATTEPVLMCELDAQYDSDDLREDATTAAQSSAAFASFERAHFRLDIDDTAALEALTPAAHVSDQCGVVETPLINTPLLLTAGRPPALARQRTPTPLPNGTTRRRSTPLVTGLPGVSEKLLPTSGVRPSRNRGSQTDMSTRSMEELYSRVPLSTIVLMFSQATVGLAEVLADKVDPTSEFYLQLLNDAQQIQDLSHFAHGQHNRELGLQCLANAEKLLCEARLQLLERYKIPALNNKPSASNSSKTRQNAMGCQTNHISTKNASTMVNGNSSTTTGLMVDDLEEEEMARFCFRSLFARPEPPVPRAAHTPLEVLVSPASAEGADPSAFLSSSLTSSSMLHGEAVAVPRGPSLLSEAPTNPTNTPNVADEPLTGRVTQRSLQSTARVVDLVTARDLPQRRILLERQVVEPLRRALHRFVHSPPFCPLGELSSRPKFQPHDRLLLQRDLTILQLMHDVLQRNLDIGTSMRGVLLRRSGTRIQLRKWLEIRDSVERSGKLVIEDHSKRYKFLFARPPVMNSRARREEQARLLRERTEGFDALLKRRTDKLQSMMDRSEALLNVLRRQQNENIANFVAQMYFFTSVKDHGVPQWMPQFAMPSSPSSPSSMHKRGLAAPSSPSLLRKRFSTDALANGSSSASPLATDERTLFGFKKEIDEKSLGYFFAAAGVRATRILNNQRSAGESLFDELQGGTGPDPLNRTLNEQRLGTAHSTNNGFNDTIHSLMDRREQFACETSHDAVQQPRPRVADRIDVTAEDLLRLRQGDRQAHIGPRDWWSTSAAIATSLAAAGLSNEFNPTLAALKGKDAVAYLDGRAVRPVGDMEDEFCAGVRVKQWKGGLVYLDQSPAMDDSPSRHRSPSPSKGASEEPQPLGARRTGADPRAAPQRDTSPKQQSKKVAWFGPIKRPANGTATGHEVELESTFLQGAPPPRKANPPHNSNSNHVVSQVSEPPADEASPLRCDVSRRTDGQGKASRSLVSSSAPALSVSKGGAEGRTEEADLADQQATAGAVTPALSQLSDNAEILKRALLLHSPNLSSAPSPANAATSYYVASTIMRRKPGAGVTLTPLHK